MQPFRNKLRHAAAPVAGILTVLLSPAFSLGEPIDTNRPSFSFTTGVVERGQLQVETGIAYTRAESGSDVVALPKAELRFGVTPRMEAFVSSLSWQRTDGDGASTSGLTDPDAGIKMKIGNDNGAVRMALLFKVSLPVGDKELTSDRWDPTAGFIWASAGRIPVAGTVTIKDSSSGYQVDNGLLLPFSLGEGRSAFVEWEANLPEQGGSTHWLNGGFQWLSGERVQFDLNVGLGLNDRAGNFRAGVGFSIRL
jgi:hypothetical protein